jgi:malonate transporter
MTDVLAGLIPVFAIIALGTALKQVAILDEAGWRAVERLTYFILFPCFLFGAIAFADFGGAPIGRLSLILAIAMLAMASLTFACRPALSLDGPGFTSLFQGSVRWNSYVALGAITAILGKPGLALIAVAIAVMVPLANTLCVMVLMRYASHHRASPAMLAGQVARNPLIVACAAGVAAQLVGLTVPETLATGIDLVGKAALPLGLLAVGASLDFGDLRARIMPLVAASTLKLLVMPLLVAGLAAVMGVTGPAMVAAVICAAVPGAPSSFILARQLGGDAPLMAGITTVQTVAALITMPLMLWVLA